jgi:hypothetical protein
VPVTGATFIDKPRWREAARDVGRDAPGLVFRQLPVDRAALRLVVEIEMTNHLENTEIEINAP